MSRKDDIEKLIVNQERRLQKRKEQQALFGLDAPPHILTEIEDIEAEIKKLQTELEALEDSDINEEPHGVYGEPQRARNLMTNDEQFSGVTIGKVTGGIHGSIIAGRDVTNATITMGGQPTPADKEPTVAELQQLLAEIQQGLAEIIAQQDVLKEISSAAPFTAQGAEQSVKDVAKEVEETAEVGPEEAKSMQESLTEATTLLSGILDGAKTAAEKAVEVGKAVQPIADKLAPLVEKVAVAAFWVAKLWLMGVK